jgi:molybdopterin/thiamine biosynthesis adenylyltransferase
VGMTVAIIGVGGLGAPAALALARAGVETLILIDDDSVDRSNLHRQILFRDADVGRPKVASTIDTLRRMGLKTKLEARAGRLTPTTLDRLDGADLIVECTDNFATKFLAADAARLRGLPIVHGSAIRWIGTALSVGPAGGPCYRCLFEDIPEGAQTGCDVAGIVGPVCGIVGAVQAHLAVSGASAYGTLITLDGLRDELRVRSISARAGCSLCGSARTIDAIDPARYQAAES